jgi:hypothetical protein
VEMENRGEQREKGSKKELRKRKVGRERNKS